MTPHRSHGVRYDSSMTRLRSAPGAAAALWGTAAVAILILASRWGAVVAAVPACRFRDLTGAPCLTCGSGRALTALSHGHVGAAFTYNPLGIVLFAAFLAGGVAAGLWALGLGPRRSLPSLGPRTVRRGALVFLALVLINWAYLWLRR